LGRLSFQTVPPSQGIIIWNYNLWAVCCHHWVLVVLSCICRQGQSSFSSAYSWH
jgi:hypothetical protein